MDKNFGPEVRRRIDDCHRRFFRIRPGYSDYDEQIAADSQLRKFNNQTGNLFDKSKCCDVFQQVKVDGNDMYEQRSRRVMLKYKYDKMIIQQHLTKVRLLLGLAELPDIFYIKVVLLKKALIKKDFVLDVEHNLECFIHDELTCDKYPLSFRYYDPVIQITNQLFSQK